MGLKNKLKNLFFEEVIVEEDEKENEKEEPVARQIELPKAEVRTVDKEVEDEVFDLVEEDVKTKLSNEKSSKISMEFDEDDFKIDNKQKQDDVQEEPAISRRRRNNYDDIPSVQVEVNEEVAVEKTPIQEETVAHIDERIQEKMASADVYGIAREEQRGLYEGKTTKKVFTPTPVISPVYGILDKNYKKEDVVQKKEIRLSTPSTKKLDLDMVREKAYGDLSSDISKSMMEDDIEKETDEMIYDLEENDDNVAVSNVSIGDAEEYYSELGLEYNNDYKDNSTSRRTTRTKEEKEELVEEDIDKTISRRTEKNAEENEDLESNLFDLVDSMYEDKE